MYKITVFYITICMYKVRIVSFYSKLMKLLSIHLVTFCNVLQTEDRSLKVAIMWCSKLYTFLGIKMWNLFDLW